ncbi:DUF1002 domain-containing protein [Bacillus thuringiensis]|uniref:DUF1002 domain-containing protein n=1 Tax=Bacillus thuringiensis TaxID=1428 RepID=UPI0021D65286|nr:DUF1002 domain-containing protein [Bacillus thuringiensis]MCU7666842.1 DUF1002 domain-containing protein [Bacillus thuringiensis]
MKKTKKIALSVVATIGMGLAFTQVVQADSAPGDVVVSLGKDLTPDQKTSLLGKMNVPKNAILIDVTNAEEDKYLGKLLPKTTIGTRAISSVKITIGNPDTGIKVQADNINWVTEDMYKNAMITAGVKDASVEVVAPFSVSGTAALTGIFKAYEKTTDVKITEDQKEVANEELVKTAKLGDSIGSDKAVEFMELAKAALAEKNPENKAEIEAIVDNAANETGVQLTKEESEGVVTLLDNMKNAGVDFQHIKDGLSVAKDKVDAIINSEETKNIIQKLGDLFKAVVDAIKSWFN